MKDAEVDALLRRADASLEAARRLLDSSVVAKRLGVTSRTVRRLCVDGKLKHQQTPGGHYRIPVSELARLLNKVGQSGQAGHTR